MNRFRFSILQALGVITFVAVGCAALAQPSLLWASAAWSITIAVLAAAVLGATIRRGRNRAFWLGFAFFGWGHMVLVLAPWFEDNTGELLLSRQLLDRLGRAIGHEVSDIATMPGVWLNLPWQPGYRYLKYVVIGQSLLTLVVAFFGGLVARYFYAANARTSKNPFEHL